MNITVTVVKTRTIATILLCTLCAMTRAADANVEEYDTSVKLHLDGSVTATRTVRVLVNKKETKFTFYFASTSQAGDYVYHYRRELLSAEADLGAGFQPIHSQVKIRQDYWYCTLGDETRDFPRKTTFRLTTREWGDTFRHGEGTGFRYWAIPSRAEGGSQASVSVEIPPEVAQGARFDFIVGQNNTMDGAMVNGSTPKAFAANEFEADLLAPNKANFRMLRPMRKWEKIDLAVYTPSSAIAKTAYYDQDSGEPTDDQIKFVLLALGGFGLVATGVLVVVIVLARNRRPPAAPPKMYGF